MAIEDKHNGGETSADSGYANGKSAKHDPHQSIASLEYILEYISKIYTTRNALSLLDALPI